MNIEDFKIDLEEKCLDFIRSCSEYDNTYSDKTTFRIAFLAGCFESDYPFLSELFNYVLTGRHSAIDEMPF